MPYFPIITKWICTFPLSRFVWKYLENLFKWCDMQRLRGDTKRNKTTNWDIKTHWNNVPVFVGNTIWLWVWVWRPYSPSRLMCANQLPPFHLTVNSCGFLLLLHTVLLCQQAALAKDEECSQVSASLPERRLLGADWQRAEVGAHKWEINTNWWAYKFPHPPSPVNWRRVVAPVVHIAYQTSNDRKMRVEGATGEWCLRNLGILLQRRHDEGGGTPEKNIYEGEEY